MKKNNRSFWRFALLIYSTVMFFLLFARSSNRMEGLNYTQLLQQNINLTPLLTIRNYWHVLQNGTAPALVRHCFINLAGNILLFIPFGILLPQCFQRLKNFFWFFLTCTAGICLVELGQLVTLVGSLDVDDLILNLSGAVLGFLLYLPSAGKKGKKS